MTTKRCPKGASVSSKQRRSQRKLYCFVCDKRTLMHPRGVTAYECGKCGRSTTRHDAQTLPQIMSKS